MATTSYHPCFYNISNAMTTTRMPHFYYQNVFGMPKYFDTSFPHYNFRDQSLSPSQNWSSFDTLADEDYEYGAIDVSTATPSSDRSNAAALSKKLARLNTIAYLYITPIIIVIGIIGDILSVAVLSHPLLRKTSVVYSYLLALAVTDLLTLVSVIPPILWLMKIKLCSLAAARYYAHVGFPLANAFMGASVYIVVFLTFNQYMAVCHPFVRSDVIRSRRNCLILTLVAYVMSFALYVPWAWKKNVRFVGDLHDAFKACPYEVCDNHDVIDAVWYKIYQWTREMISRFVPFLLIAYFNLRMLYVYRRTRAQRMNVVSLREQKLTLRQKTEREQRRLWALLFGIMTLFFVCTIPAMPFTIMVSDLLEHNLTFQTFRAITNVLEFTKFALNFYLYCMINPDIRRLCLKRLTCQTSINAFKAPMVASRNSYHLSDLLQMSERKQKQNVYNQQHRRSAGTGSGSYDFNPKPRRSVRSRQDSERPLLAGSSTRKSDASPCPDSHRSSRTSPSCSITTIPKKQLPDSCKQTNGSVLTAIQRSDTDIILHDKPIVESSTCLSLSHIFNEEITGGLESDRSFAVCDKLTKSTHADSCD